MEENRTQTNQSTIPTVKAEGPIEMKESHIRILNDDLNAVPALWRPGSIHNAKFKDISTAEIISEFIKDLPGVMAYESGIIFETMIQFCNAPNAPDLLSVAQHVNALAVKLYGPGIGDMVK